LISQFWRDCDNRQASGALKQSVNRTRTSSPYAAKGNVRSRTFRARRRWRIESVTEGSGAGG
jgi:hypothetical protein